jgi:hypothetical protein
MKLQKDRQYELRVSDKNGKGYVIDNLHIDFTVNKSSNNKQKPNKASLRIYNLSEERQKWFETPFLELTLLVGYAGLGIHKLFSGQITVAGTQKQGADTVTEIQLDTLYTELNSTKISQTAPAGTSVKEVIEKAALGMRVVKVVYSGENIKKSFVDGYPMVGTPRQILTELAEAFELEWQVDQQFLYISDVGKSYMTDNSKAYVVGENSGLIERPYFDNIEKRRGKGDKLKEARRGVKLKILLNPAINAGSVIKIDFGEFTGFYKVERLTHKGGIYTEEWETELACGTML